MTQFISNLGHSIARMLPQTEVTNQALEKIEKQQNELRNALSDKTCTLFLSRKTGVITTLHDEKSACINRLKNLNGNYFQDPTSLLKKTWDKIVTKVNTVFGFTINTRGDLDSALTQLNSTEETQEVKLAKFAIDAFCRLETKRNALENRVEQITAIEKTGALPINTSLIAQKQKLEARQHELCGNYFQDPTSLLDQAWVKLQNAISAVSANIVDLSTAFYSLEEERKQIEAQLHSINQLLSVSASPDRTYEKLTIDVIQKEIDLLEKAKTSPDISHIDWKRTIMATTAAASGILTMGFSLIR